MSLLLASLRRRFMQSIFIRHLLTDIFIIKLFIRFDVLVNGGGAVTLQFQRSPFRPLTRTVFVPWNQIVALPTGMYLYIDTKFYL